MRRSSLFSEHPWRIDIPLIILASATVLYFGVTTPVVALSSLVYPDSSYSVLQGIERFWQTGDRFIGGLVLVFSVVFPVAKLAVLLGVWLVPTLPARRRRSLSLVESLGKWSMLDVLVVILFAGSVKLGFIADVGVRSGAYIFGAAVLLSMIAAMLMSRIAGGGGGVPTEPRRRSLLLPPVALTGVVLFLVALSMPLMTVEKWYFWEAEYSLLRGVVALMSQGHVAMAVGFALFVVVLPLLLHLAQLSLALIQLAGRGGGPYAAWLVAVQRWAMTDVFALALFIVVIRLSRWTSVVPKLGLYCFVAALGFSSVSSIWLRRLYPREASDALYDPVERAGGELGSRESA